MDTAFGEGRLTWRQPGVMAKVWGRMPAQGSPCGFLFITCRNGLRVEGVRSSVEAKIKLGKHPALLGMFPESGLGCCHRHATNRAAKESTDDVIVLKAVLSLVGSEHFGQFWIVVG